MNGKVATKYAPKLAPDFTLEPLLVRQSVDAMTPQQFAVYDAQIRTLNYYAMNATEQHNYMLALQAVNARAQREAEPGFNVTIRGGTAEPGIFPAGVPWIPLIAVGIVLFLASRL